MYDNPWDGWIEQGNHFYGKSQREFRGGYYSDACFSAQKSVECYAKALIIRRTSLRPSDGRQFKEHPIKDCFEKLLNNRVVTEEEVNEFRTDISELTSFPRHEGTPKEFNCQVDQTIFPTDEEGIPPIKDFTPQQAQRKIEAAGRLIEFISGNLDI